jgi:hypothetical protein
LHYGINKLGNTLPQPETLAAFRQALDEGKITEKERACATSYCPHMARASVQLNSWNTISATPLMLHLAEV